MVCEKNADCTHDFDLDPIDLYIENGILKARGTTLGADDGMGCAYMLALLDMDTPHPALELSLIHIFSVAGDHADRIGNTLAFGRRAGTVSYTHLDITQLQKIIKMQSELASLQISLD